VIEIELADGTRRHVDAFSNEQERRRVPAMLGVVRMGIVRSAKIWRPVRGSDACKVCPTPSSVVCLQPAG
jgi:hypothetical protein